jgi:hypothetical protein
MNMIVYILWAAVTPGVFTPASATKYAVDNTTTWTATTTYDGSGQGMHPSVVTSGTTYYMGITPYPGGDRQYEAPSVLESTDLVTWAAPSGLTNPVINDPSGVDNTADVELCTSGTNLFLWCLETSGSVTQALTRVTSSTDVVNWGTSQTVAIDPIYPYDLLSPSVLFDGTSWTVWGIQPGQGNLCRWNMTDYKTLKSTESCTITPSHLSSLWGGLWHCDVIKQGSTYIMLVCSYDWTQGHFGMTVPYHRNAIFLLTSTDGLSWSLYQEAVFISSSTDPSWDELLYRPTMVWDDGNLIIWYCASDSSAIWHTSTAIRADWDQLVRDIQVDDAMKVW